MRVLLDACLPQSLRHELPGHDVFTAAFMGWSHLLNGDLFKVMNADGFEVLVTADTNLPHQQSLRQFGIAVFVLRSATNRRVDRLPLMTKLLQLLQFAAKGTVVEVLP